MTGSPDQVVRWRGSDIARWSLCAATILAVHAGAAAYIVTREPDPPPGGLPTVAVMEMLPEVSAPPNPIAEAPPGPEMQKTEELPEKLAEKPEEEEAVPEEPVKQVEPEPEVPPAPLAPKPEVAVAPREPEPPVEAKPVEKKPIEVPKRPEPKKKRVPKPKPATTAPPPSQTARAQSAPLALAPPVPSNAMPDWNRTISAMLQRSLRYPSDAERRGIKGSANVRLSIGRDGNLISASLVSSAGDSQLDQEAVAVARRASPFPPPPGGAVTRVIPIRFR